MPFGVPRCARKTNTFSTRNSINFCSGTRCALEKYLLHHGIQIFSTFSQPYVWHMDCDNCDIICISIPKYNFHVLDIGRGFNVCFTDVSMVTLLDLKTSTA